MGNRSNRRPKNRRTPLNVKKCPKGLHTLKRRTAGKEGIRERWDAGEMDEVGNSYMEKLCKALNNPKLFEDFKKCPRDNKLRTLLGMEDGIGEGFPFTKINC